MKTLNLDARPVSGILLLANPVAGKASELIPLYPDWQDVFASFSNIQIALMLITPLAALWLMARWLGSSAAGQRGDAASRTGHEASPEDAYPTTANQTIPMSHFHSMVEVRKEMNPLTEAEVYLSFGQDRDAEALLLDAIRRAPMKMGLRIKLAEIYAQRRDAVSFRTVAVKLSLMTGGSGPVWEHICDMGRRLDTGDPDYGAEQSSAPGKFTELVFKTLRPDAGSFEDTGPPSLSVAYEDEQHGGGRQKSTA